MAGPFGFLRHVTAKSWLEQGDAGGAVALAPQRIALWMFLAVITSVFFLFGMAYRMRMALPDWQSIAVPGLLVLNTLLLIGASVTLQRARGAAQRDEAAAVRRGLVVAGLLTLAFLVGQYIAWAEIAGRVPAADIPAGILAVRTSPANAFFYLVTGVHGLHLLGGLYAWARTVTRLLRGAEVVEVQLAVELLAVYWHYLLAVWLALYALLLLT